ncbi:putative RPL43B-60S large subunit ribosomal protein [Ilyonectria robusta]
MGQRPTRQAQGGSGTAPSSADVARSGTSSFSATDDENDAQIFHFQSPSVVAGSIAWRRQRGCCITVSSPLLNPAWPDSGLDARDGVSTTSNGALARLAVPDTGSVSSDGGLAAEGAGVLGVLGDFHLLHLLSERGTITG